MSNLKTTPPAGPMTSIRQSRWLGSLLAMSRASSEGLLPERFATESSRRFFEDAARIVRKIIRAPVYLSAPSRSSGPTEMLFKIQLIKFNLIVSVDCAPR